MREENPKRRSKRELARDAAAARRREREQLRRRRLVERQARKACGGIRASRCLLEALAAGEDLQVRQARSSWGIYRGDERKALARRPTRDAADAALDAVRELLELGREASCPPCLSDLPGTPEERQRTRVVTPQLPRGEPARYAAVEADELVPSHHPVTFQPDPRYPADVQERQYHSDPNEQRKVIVGAQTLDPAVVLGTNPTPADGPPLVTEDGLVLGGNGRTLMLKRAYGTGLPTAAAYRAELERRAATFGLDASTFRSMAAPILVRRLEGVSRATPRAELAAAVRRFNEALTNAIDSKAKAVSQARLLSADSVGRLGELLREHPDGSLRELMRDRPQDLARLLTTDGILTDSNRSEWVTAAGELTESAKDQLEGMFLGRVVGSADRYRLTPAALLRKLERAVPHLVAIAARNPGLDVVPAVQRAVDLLNEAKVRGLELEQLLAQGTLFGGAGAGDDVVAIARLFNGTGQRGIAERFSAWARLADFDPRQASMFGAPPTRAEALAALTGEPMRTKNPTGRSPACKRPPKSKCRCGCECAKAGRVSNPCNGRCLAGRNDCNCSSCGGRCHGARTCGCARRKNPPGVGAGELRVTVVRDNEGRAHPALYRLAGGQRVYEAVGDATKTSFETALEQARRLAKKLKIPVELEGVLEVGSVREKNPSSKWAPLVRSAATTASGLVEDLRKQLGRVPATGAAWVKSSGLADWLRLEFDGGRVKRARLGSRQQPQLAKALNAAVKAGGGEPSKPGVSSPRRRRRMSEIKAPNDRPGAGKTARSASLADQLEAELGDNISPLGRELLQLRRELEEAGEGWTDEEIEEFHRSRSGE